eukprot:TRINITY_DN6660_c0_g2_i1.p1 TRINITY_DN6660_c0_g2~~TRINITY_DN6660_c0_g2_i1.p1  ORF type:complete len:487 (-),score=118.78 TRINITY_DN6660_c0_g2_i1:52-1341(-)
MASSRDPSCPVENVLAFDTGSYWLSTGLYPQEILLRLERPCSLACVQLAATKVRRIRIEGCQEAVPVNFQPLCERELPDAGSGGVQREEFACETVWGHIAFVRVHILSGWHDFCSVQGLRVLARDGGMEAMEEQMKEARRSHDSLCLSVSDAGGTSLLDISLSRHVSKGNGARRQFKVAVWCPSGSSCELEADETWTVGQVKGRMERELGIPAVEQKIVVGTEPLGDTELLIDIAAASGVAEDGDADVGDREPELTRPRAPGVLHLTVVRCQARQATFITQVKRDGLLLRFAEELRDDRDVALAAVLQNGDALQFVGEGLRSDRDLVMTAVQQRGSAVQWAADSLRCDHAVAMAAVSQNGAALCHVDRSLREDREVVLAAVRQKGSALRDASQTLRGDPEVVQAACETFYFSQEELSRLAERPDSAGSD